LDELLKASRADFDAKQAEMEAQQAEVDRLSKEIIQAKEEFESRQHEIEQEHEENIKRLEKGFSMTLQAKDEEIENLQIIGNKYKKKNESLKKDVRSLLTKLDTANQRKMSVGSTRASSPGHDSDLAPPAIPTSIGSHTADEDDSVSSMPISFSESKLKLKDKFDRAKKWRKSRNIMKVPDILPEVLQNRPGRCVSIEKLTKTQLVAKCNTLQLLAGELTLQVDTYNEQVQNLKFASTYLGKRVLALESTLDLMPGEEIPKNIGSRIADLRAVIEAEKLETRQSTSAVEKLTATENVNERTVRQANNMPDDEHEYKEGGAS